MQLLWDWHVLHDSWRGVLGDLSKLPLRFVPVWHGHSLQRCVRHLPLGDLLDAAGGQCVHELPRQQRFNHFGGGLAVRLQM